MGRFRLPRIRWRRLAWAAVFGGALFGALWRYAQAPYVLNLPDTARLQMEANVDHFRCLSLNCAGVDPSLNIEVLGNPAAQRYPDCNKAFARNPWDLAFHDGRLFIGLGDDSNSGPSANAGPVPVLAYDLNSGKFTQESALDEEQLDRFYRHDGALWAPGTDPRQSWRLGNLYRRDGASWTKQRTIPKAIHAHALTWHKGAVFAGLTATDVVPEALGQEHWGSAAARSSDGGIHWEFFPLGGLRVFEFLKVGGRLYATDIFPGPGAEAWLKREGREGKHAPVYEWLETGEFQRRTDLDAEHLFPDSPLAGKRSVSIDRAVTWGDRSAYLGIFSATKEAPTTQAAYWAESLAEGNLMVKRIPLPEKALALDVLVEGNRLFVLFSEPQENGAPGWINQVWSSADGDKWIPEIRFNARNPARAFEKVGEDWFFGLGGFLPPQPGVCAPQDAATGTLLRVRKNRHQ